MAPSADADVEEEGTGRRYLVTGVLGAIGAWTAKALVDRGCAVIGLDVGSSRHRLDVAFDGDEPHDLTLVEGDITDLDALERLI